VCGWLQREWHYDTTAFVFVVCISCFSHSHIYLFSWLYLTEWRLSPRRLELLQ
jgi:hypothetical protein